MALATDDNVWTVRAALEWTQGYLERKGDENPRLSAQWLIAEACELSRIELYANFERPLSPDERSVLRGYVTQRGQGMPLQYITGETGFRLITVKIRPGVLIPRPETEVLVSEALALLPAPEHPRSTDEDALGQAQTGEEQPDEQAGAGRAQADEQAGAGRAQADEQGDAKRARTDEQTGMSQSQAEEPRQEQVGTEWAQTGERGQEQGYAGQAQVRKRTDPERMHTEMQEQVDAGQERESKPPLVVDLCTGSGCVACSIAHEHPGANVIATDISPEATALARENATLAGLEERVRVIECDLGEAVPENLLGTFDLVVSNPPYVPTQELATIPREVADFEPKLALDGGDDGLDVVRRMLPWCARALKPGGGLALELHEAHCDDASSLVSDAGFEDVRIVHDLAGRPRVLVARRKTSATPPEQSEA